MVEKQDLIDFECRIKRLFEEGKLPYPIHFSGGNEDQLIEIFKEIKPGDYVFSTHRNHYHYLLAGGNPDELEKRILNGKSMYAFNREVNFLSSAIVSGCATIAAGTALGLKRKGSNNRVWCFVGDGGEDQGHFYEAVRYVDGHNLPCTFIIEDNNMSVETPKKERYGTSSEIQWPECVRRYNYNHTFPHVGTGKWIKFGDSMAGGGSSF
jgi:TPP-dependent pyruvate/acetoin dehydrogenase alpha subunit